MLIFGQEKALLPWAAERIGVRQFRADARAIGLRISDRLRAVVVYDTFSECDCHMHIASDGEPNWLTREFLVHAFSYPFIQCGMRRVTGLVDAKNKPALRLDLHLGFVVEGFHPKAMPQGDVYTLGMLRETCRFIPRELRHA